MALEKSTIADLITTAEKHLYEAQFATEYYYWSGRLSVLKELYRMIKFDPAYDEKKSE